MQVEASATRGKVNYSLHIERFFFVTLEQIHTNKTVTLKRGIEREREWEIKRKIAK